MEINKRQPLKELLTTVANKLSANNSARIEINKLKRRFRLSSLELIAFSYLYNCWINQINSEGNIPLFKIGKGLYSIIGKGREIENILDRLVSLKLIELASGTLSNTSSYRLEASVINSIKEDKVPFIMRSEPNIWYLCDQLSFCFDFIKKKAKSRFHAERMLLRMEDDFKELNACRLIFDMKLSYEERLIYYYMIFHVANGNCCIDSSELLEEFNVPFSRLMPFRYALIEGNSPFIEAGIFQSGREKIVKQGNIKLFPTDKWLKEIFGENYVWICNKAEFQRNIYGKSQEDEFRILDPRDIRKVELFHNLSDSSLLKQIQQMLVHENYQKSIELLKSEHEKQGITILLSGGPGTGKTETVRQWARLTGRSIFWLDFAEMTNSLVGESEKSVRKVFSDYHRNIVIDKNAPILLLNEADGLLGKRTKVRQAVDRMNNTIQNILLEELEQFEGILIATTNNTENIDSAFMRRFLFKIQIGKPDQATRFLMTKERLPFMTNEQHMVLAEIPFSGGHLDNIARRSLMHRVMNYSYPDLPTISNWFKEENIFYQSNSQNGIGYLRAKC